MPSGPTKLVWNNCDFSGGVDSGRVPIIRDAQNINGLLANQLAWGQNITTRGGPVSPRSGLFRKISLEYPGFFQDAQIYLPISGPAYILASIGGVILKIDPLTGSVTNLSEQFQLFNPPDTRNELNPHGKAFMQQGEEFMVIQAGDFITLPLFWDGISLTRSRGMVSTLLPDASFTVPAIGQPVLVTLSAPYAGATNQYFTIDGYLYQQVVNDQRYSLAANGYSLACNLVGKTANFPAGFTFTPIRTATENAVLVRDIAYQFTAGSNPATGPVIDAFFISETLDVGAFNYVTYEYDFGSGCTAEIRLDPSANPLAAPNPATEVWLVNVNDPRAGQAIALQSLKSQLPAAGPMDYYGKRMWLANGREYLAGDIAGGPSGSPPYNYRDAILYVDENTYLSEGGTFSVPVNSGPITALSHNANLDTALGEGTLFIFTRGQIFGSNVPFDRSTWAALEEPIQKVAQIHFGTVSDRSVVPVNGDLFYRTPEGVQTLISAIRYFGQWGNTPISSEEDRAISSDVPELLDCVSATQFDNRFLMTCLPELTDRGVVFYGMMPMDFNPISGMREKSPPAWEGIREGLPILKLVSGNFSGVERCYAFVRSSLTGKIELWEITKEDREDTNDVLYPGSTNRITWIIETPAYTFNNANQLKELESSRLWVDRLYGRVDFSLYYRNDQYPCWHHWHSWTECAARNNCEDPGVTNCPYPTQIYKAQYRIPMTMPKPSAEICDVPNNRPSIQGYSFQLRLVIKGYCRLRGIATVVLPRDEEAFQGLDCIGDNPCRSCPEGAEGPEGQPGSPGTGIQTFFGDEADPNSVTIDGADEGDIYRSRLDRSLWVFRSGAWI